MYCSTNNEYHHKNITHNPPLKKDPPASSIHAGSNPEKKEKNLTKQHFSKKEYIHQHYSKIIQNPPIPKLVACIISQIRHLQFPELVT